MKLVIHSVFIFMLSFSLGYAQTIPPANSSKTVEVKIASLLKKKLNINTTLKVIDDKGDNLRVTTLFAADIKKKLPKVIAFIDTRVISQSKTGVASSQVISIFSMAEIKVDTKNRLKLLEWANAWNNNVLPIRIQISKNKIIAATNLVTTKSNPIDENIILSSYLSIIQIWPAIIQSLDKSKLLIK